LNMTTSAMGRLPLTVDIYSASDAVDGP
jgi:hypothetical protein